MTARVPDATRHAEVAQRQSRTRGGLFVPELRPDDYLPGIFDRLLEGESLTTICAEPGMPSKATVLRWLHVDERWAAEYVKVRQLYASSLELEVAELRRRLVDGDLPSDVARVAHQMIAWETAVKDRGRFSLQNREVHVSGSVKVEHSISEKLARARARAIENHGDGPVIDGQAVEIVTGE